jgi:16S rRNA (adenine1518-N6/adenine1519-N6)-dimethyltransferase
VSDEQSPSGERAGEGCGGGNGAPSFRDPDALRRRAGVRGDTDQDQHFLVDDRVLDRLPAYATDMIDPAGEAGTLGHVLEIGAGTGALTDRLLAAATHVTAIERHPSLAAFLREEFSSLVEAGRLTVVEGDALAVELPDFDVCVSNLPYGPSSEIAFRLLPRERPLVLMFQQEFAERMVADPATDDYGRLSVTAGHYADVELVETVPREAFDPQPRVESAIVRTAPRSPEYEVPDEALFLDFLRGVFTQRRKTMRNAIRNTAHITGLDDPDAVVAAADEELMSKRAGNLSPETFAELATLAADVGEPDGG